ncbi:glycosyltransferase family A protein [Maribellus maritimus]|uniref:glycosyltransferase family A protein n=1 Tax=Maribellus maritimus TaxID=2870838 RepID=UPI001EEA058A|nr:glycosyltransferase family 2 protein [Maribellus maritimus]MCG6190237.1 glycosyltransferase family 2 protein [Maribellus maritimus]
MSFTDLLTIAMPVYERKEFFEKALDSALNQTVRCKVIVMDNCSSHDFFEKVCKQKGVTYYRNEKNIGMAGNFSKGYQLSQTEYTLNLQDDDRLAPNYVEAFVDAVTKHPDIDIFYSDFVRDTPKGELPHKHTLPFGYMKSGEKVIEYGIKYKLGFPYVASSIRNTKAFKYEEIAGNIGSYDWEWIYSVADKYSFYGDSRRLYYFRDHDMQDTKVNSMIYRFTLPYIYDKILLGKAANKKLQKRAQKNAFWELMHLKSLASKKEIEELIKGGTKYHIYLKEKLDDDHLVKTIFAAPQKPFNLAFKSLLKLGLIA